MAWVVALAWPGLALAMDAEAIVERNKDAVVTVFAERDGDPRAVQGSGCCVDPTGLVLTVAHTLRGSKEFLARFRDGSERPLELVTQDEEQDVALLRTKGPVAAVVVGDSDALREGSPLVAVSAPKGLHASVSSGIVSSLDRVYNGRPVLQTDLDLHEGSSGGPVFDRHGRLVGLVAARLDSVGAVTLVRPINGAYALLRKYGVDVPEPGGAPFEEVAAAPNAPEPQREAVEAYNRGVTALDVNTKVPLYESAVRLWPSFHEAWFNLGVAYAAQGREDDAIAAYRKAKALRPDSVPALRNLGRLLLKQDRLDEVLDCFEAAADYAPEDAGVMNDLGEAYRRAGRLDEARSRFQKALSLRRDYGAALYNLGLTCMALERWNEAYAAFHRYLVLAPHATDTEKVRGWMAELKQKSEQTSK
jgi:S1-C subfamily serine protease